MASLQLRVLILLALFTTYSACGGESTGSDPGPLLGRWQTVVGDDLVLQFLDDGTLIGAEEGRQAFGSYRILEPGQMVSVIEGDTILLDFEVAGDTLRYSIVGEPQKYVAIKVQNR